MANHVLRLLTITLLPAFMLGCSVGTTPNKPQNKIMTYGSGEEMVFRKVTVAPFINTRSRYDIWYVMPGSSHIEHLAYRLSITKMSRDGRSMFFSTRSAKSRCDGFTLNQIEPNLFELTSGRQSILLSPIDETISANSIRGLAAVATTNRNDKIKTHPVLLPMIIPKCTA